MSHAVELWEMVGDERAIFTPACLSCGWVGSDTRHRLDAVREGRRHEEGIREPWVLVPGERAGWEGDPRSRVGEISLAILRRRERVASSRLSRPRPRKDLHEARS